jgi:hypothetical protein
VEDRDIGRAGDLLLGRLRNEQGGDEQENFRAHDFDDRIFLALWRRIMRHGDEKRMANRCLTVEALLALAAGVLEGAVIRGVVVENQSGRPLACALVTAQRVATAFGENTRRTS